MKINYQIEMERELARIAADGRRPRLLLHSCCAPCSSFVLERLTDVFDISVFYYNPNIAPKEEFLRRVDEQQRLIDALPHLLQREFGYAPRIVAGGTWGANAPSRQAVEAPPVHICPSATKCASASWAIRSFATTRS